MTDDLERLEALARAATPGPWYGVGTLVEHPSEAVADICSCDPRDFGQANDLEWSQEDIRANAAFIAIANPAAILSLIQRVREADRLLKIESGIRYAAQQNFLNAFANGHASGRAEALEEAAKVAEDFFIDPLGPYEVQERITAAIRALGEKA